MKKTNIKSYVLQGLALFSAMLFGIGAFCAGLYLSKTLNESDLAFAQNVSSWVTVACLVLLFGSLAVNIIFYFVLNKKIAKNVRGMYDWFIKTKEQTQANLSVAERKLNIAIFFSYFYLVMLILVTSAPCFIIGIFSLELEEIIPLTIIIIFVYWGFFSVLFTPPQNGGLPEKEFVFDEAEFPLIYGIAEKAADLSGCKKRVVLAAGGYGISVSEYGDCVCIFIDPIELCVLTQNEFFNVLLHEFAHVVNADTKRASRYIKISEQWESPNFNIISSIANVFILIPKELLSLKIDMYKTLSSITCERNADASIKKLGEPQAYANALAKSFCVSKFRELPHPELDYYFYEPESPADDYLKREYKLFLKYLDKYAVKWAELVEKELPAQVDTHPILKERLKTAGCESYDVFTKESDEFFTAECDKAIEKLDKLLYGQNAPNYKEMREQNFIKPKQAIESYISAKENASLTDEIKLSAMLDAQGIDDALALEIADGILEENPSFASANLVKARILSRNYDDECIKYFIEAKKDPSYAFEAMQDMAGYALKTGNTELIEAYRKEAPDALSHIINQMRGLEYSNDKQFCESGLDENIIKELTEGIIKASKGLINRIYLCKFTDDSGKDYYPVILYFKKSNSPDMFKAMEDTENFIYKCSTKYDFLVYFGKANMDKKLKKVKNSLVYTAVKADK